RPRAPIAASLPGALFSLGQAAYCHPAARLCWRFGSHKPMDGLAARLQAWKKYLPLVALVPVLWHLAVLAQIFALRLTYPMDAEWMEGGELYHAWRWLHGQSIYGPPSQGFIPYGYPPFH